MDLAYGDSPFPYGGSYPAHGLIAYIPSDENSGNAGFKWKWIALQLPSFGTFAIAHQAASGPNKSR